jgi:hypothetical protein
LAHAAVGSLYFLLSVIGYIAVPMALAAFASAPSLAAIKDTLRPAAGGAAAATRRTILIAFAAPLILPALVAMVARADLDPLWSMSAMTLLPVVLLGSPLVVVRRTAAAAILALAMIVPLVLLAASPVIALVIHRQGVSNYASDYRLIAQALEQAWQAQSDKPLRIVGGNRPVVDGSNFYFTDPPATFVVTEPMRTPWVNEERIARDGIAVVCPRAEPACLRELNALMVRHGGTTQEVILARQFFGSSDTPIDYQIAIIPPG